MDIDPFARCYQRLTAMGHDAEYRLQLAQRYAYVLPEPHLVAAVARQSPLVEVGAGTGYWSYLLQQHGADVIAYDHAPLHGARINRYHFDAWPWFDVVESDAEVAARHPDRSLFVCWPPLYSSLWDVLRSYTGDRVVYIGDRGQRTTGLSGLEDTFEMVGRWGVIAMDPAPTGSAELDIWVRKPPLAAASDLSGSA